MIRISPIRLIGANDEQVGIVDTYDALQMAQEAGLDLVEISPEVRPPVCKIMDYGKYRYEQNKRPNRKATQNEIKEIRLGRSVKIGEHDVQIRVDQARKFLMAGHKVQITQRFRGREMMHKELGLARLRTIVDDLGDIAKLEMEPRWMGRQASVLLAPDRDRIKSLKDKMSREERLAAEEAEQAALEAHAAEVEELDDDEDEDDDAPEQVAAVSEETSADEKPKVEKTRKGKQRDQRAVNPVDDEISDLLG